MDTLRRIINTVKMYSTIHLPDGSPNIFLFSMPRSGSTWLMEMIYTQPGFKWSREPFNLREPVVQDHLGIDDWNELYMLRSEDKIKRYVDAICTGKLRDYRLKYPRPFGEQHRFITRHTIFKILHFGEDRINWFRDNFNGRVVYLIRHPIPVTLSRKVLPRLQARLVSDFRRHFTDAQLAFANQIIENGSQFEQGILDWCLQNMVPMRDMTDDWTLVSYEQLVLDVDPIIQLLCSRLDLPSPELMREQWARPSSSVNRQSDNATQMTLKQERTDESQNWLVEKWRKKITPEQEMRSSEILAVFGLDDCYSYGSALPSKKLWIGSE
jgi:hypothetical protein